ncbi:MAG: IS21 family transposase [Cyanothece sp. SIO1E1]|nr:IS21 family transposase [Cyanothece sp. SIO1E1]
MVQQLRKVGVSPAQVEEITGVSQRSIRRIIKEAEVTSLEPERVSEGKGAGRPSEVCEYAAEISEWLAEEREPADGPMKSQEVLARLRQRGYTGGKTAVYELVKRLRPPKQKVPMVRFEGLPGEFSQHDFGQRRVRYRDGQIEVVRFFASRLKYSRYVDVQVVDNEQQETVVRCLLRAFEAFGGVPLMGVFDNMSSAVKSREVNADGSVKVHWTDRFAQVCMDCGLIPLACWPYRPQQKGSVENLVGFVKGNFFCGRQFKDRSDLIAQLQAWVNTVNTERKCDATGEIPQVRLQRESLKPCGHNALTYAFKVSVVVRPTARVHYRGMEYSVPAHSIGQTVTLHLQQERVVIYLGERHLAEHPRRPANGKSSILSEHAQQLFTFKRGKPFAQRQILLDLEPLVEPYLTELVHRRPQTWQADIEQIYQLYEQIGRADLLAAISLATEQRCFGSEYLLVIVQSHSQSSTPPAIQLLSP